MFTVFTLLGTVFALDCPEDYFDGIDFCCRLCSVGTFLKKICNESKGNSFCEPCPVRFPTSYFRVILCLCFKTSLRAKYENEFDLHEREHIFIEMVPYEDSF